MARVTHVPDTGITILPPQDVEQMLVGLRSSVTVTMLDPWYNRGVGGLRDDYDSWLANVVTLAGERSDHVFVWGFPEIVYRVLDRLPPTLSLVAWLTWYYKNCPSVIRGWRSAQMTCLHLSRPKARLYPEHFLVESQLAKQREGKLRYMPGPPSVLEVPLNIGFVGKKEQTGHPSQKPERVFEQLYRMTTKPGDTVVDPMCGSGTTGVVCRALGLNAILSDSEDQYIGMTEQRLGLKRLQSPKYARKKAYTSRLVAVGAD